MSSECFGNFIKNKCCCPLLRNFKAFTPLKIPFKVWETSSQIICEKVFEKVFEMLNTLCIEYGLKLEVLPPSSDNCGGREDCTGCQESQRQEESKSSKGKEGSQGSSSVAGLLLAASL